MRSSNFLVMTVLLTGCPEPIPVEDPGYTGAQAPVDGQAPPTAGPPTDVMGAPVAANSAGGPISAGTFGDNIPESELSPKFLQEQLTDGVTVKGELACADCTGQLLVRVLPPPPSETTGAAGDIQLITVAVFDAAGPFETKVPTEGTIVLQVVDDSNSDGQPSSGERMGFGDSGPLEIAGDIADIKLEVGHFPAMPELDFQGQPMTGEIEGPANPEAPVTEPVVPDGEVLEGAAELPAPEDAAAEEAAAEDAPSEDAPAEDAPAEGGTDGTDGE